MMFPPLFLISSGSRKSCLLFEQPYYIMKKRPAQWAIHYAGYRKNRYSFALCTEKSSKTVQSIQETAMELKELEYIVAVAEERSISKAADRLYLA